MSKYRFIDDKGTFELENPENYSYLYFPIAGEQGIKSAVTPNLGGDIKENQNVFIMEPVSAENLHNNRSTRNFWCNIKGLGCWSVTGASAEEESRKFTSEQEESKLTAGLMWQEVSRESKKYGMKAKVTSFVPTKHNVEIMHVEILNTGKEEKLITPTAAVPIYGRSAANIRDHRHVTSLLHRIHTTEYGVEVTPTLSFDERGHQKNEVTYFVCGVGQTGEKPEDFYPVVEEYIGEGGSFTHPRAVLENRAGEKAGSVKEGKEAVGGIHFKEVTLAAGQTISYTIIIGATCENEKIKDCVEAYNTDEKVKEALEETKSYWQEKVNVGYHTDNKDFDNYMRWVSFQPILRRIYGCSFLPHHDYGKGGRGWRDLWQDCLALLIMNPSGVRQMIVDNFRGVRMDGTNATIIGEKQGEFIADRNNITRVWMDHGVWPFITTKLYIDQTGDIEILKEKIPYFKDGQAVRGTAVDEEWNDSYGREQKTKENVVYTGSVIEHLLVQNLSAFYEVGEHNHLRMRGADWNDALDMAEERGESVAFSNAYAGNLKDLAKYLEAYKEKTKEQKLLVAEEIEQLFVDDLSVYEDINKKKSILEKYAKDCIHTVDGKLKEIEIDRIIEVLNKMSDWMMEHIRKTEWVTDKKGHGWFNSYYDNNGRRVEGEFENGVHMMLTGQVFSIMNGTALPEQVKEICESADRYLYQKEIGGYRLNTNFHELRFDLGRMFGFAYGEKENGAVFSHMTVMYAYALYKAGFVEEGHKALQTLADTALRFSTSKIYPGIPEYFNASGRGMYHYLTGAASWYMLTMITEVFGVRGYLGDLVIEPKLLAEQFDEEGVAAVTVPFAGHNFKVVFKNENKVPFGEYHITKASYLGKTTTVDSNDKLIISRNEIAKMDEIEQTIEITLD